MACPLSLAASPWSGETPAVRCTGAGLVLIRFLGYPGVILQFLLWFGTASWLVPNVGVGRLRPAAGGFVVQDE